MANRFEMYFVAYYMHILLLNYTNLKTFWQFENFVFVIMPTWENIHLMARTPFERGHHGEHSCEII